MSKSTYTNATQPARHHINVLGQMLKFIPRDIIHKTAKETGVDLKARSYSVRSYGRRCWCMCCCALRRTSASGGTALHASLPWRARRGGSDLTSWGCCEVMGQQEGALPCWELRTQRGCQGLSHRRLHLMGQHPPDFAATTAKPQLDPCHFRAIPPRYFKACPSFVTAYGMAVFQVQSFTR